MSAKLPPVPPENRAGTFDDRTPPRDTTRGEQKPLKPDQQGQQANTRQNTTHQGYQEDR